MDEKKRKPYTMEEKDDGLIKNGAIKFLYITQENDFLKRACFGE